MPGGQPKCRKRSYIRQRGTRTTGNGQGGGKEKRGRPQLGRAKVRGRRQELGIREGETNNAAKTPKRTSFIIARSRVAPALKQLTSQRPDGESTPEEASAEIFSDERSRAAITDQRHTIIPRLAGQGVDKARRDNTQEPCRPTELIQGPEGRPHPVLGLPGPRAKGRSRTERRGDRWHEPMKGLDSGRKVRHN